MNLLGNRVFADVIGYDEIILAERAIILWLASL